MDYEGFPIKKVEHPLSINPSMTDFAKTFKEMYENS